MNSQGIKELVSMLKELQPSDIADLRKYVEIMRLSRRADMKPPTAEQWERLTEWQKIRLLWMISYRRAIRRILRNFKLIVIGGE
jgi:hypothetical protein